MTRLLRTYAYVDGLNLYYRAVKGTAHKWLDIPLLIRSLLRPENDVVRVRYFTADVSGRRDPNAPVRQQAFLRALATNPSVSIHKGSFLVSTKWAEIASPPGNFLRPNPVVVWVVKTEEKGSDVNLAAHLLNDAFNDRFDVAVVLSNDTDLVEPIRMVRDEIHKAVGLICPSPKPAESLRRVASFIRHVTQSRLAGAQLPDPIPGTTIRKPATW
jgi:uncharacterized LabA/DUF88 family protein